MVNQTYAGTNEHHDRSDDTCPFPSNSSNETSSDGEFEWDQTTQSNVLGAFFYGYMVMQIPVTYGGTQMGTIIGLPLAGLLCQSASLGGWPTVFYLYGVLGIVWFVCWTFLCFDDPSKHPRITAAERDFIQTSLGKVREASLRLLGKPSSRLFRFGPSSALTSASTGRFTRC